MKIDMTVTFDKEDMREILTAEYIRVFGAPRAGYELNVNDRYGSWEVEMVQKEEEPEKEIEK